MLGVMSAGAVGPEVTLEELGAKSDAAVRGTVVSEKVFYSESEGQVWTRFEVSVRYGIVGDVGAKFQIDVPGGYLAERDLGEWYSHSPELEVGGDYVLFLMRRDDGWEVAADAAGVWDVEDGFVAQQDERRMVSIGAFLDSLNSVLSTAGREGRLPDNWHNLEREVAGVASLPMNGETRVREISAPPAFRWDADSEMKWRSLPVTFLVNLNSRSIPANGSAEEFLEQIRLGAEVWNNVPSSEFEFVYSGSSAVEDYFQGGNGANDIYFDPIPGGVFGAPYARAYTSWSSQQGFREADIRINDDYTFKVLREPFETGIDLRSIVAHEFGHCLGLGHDGILMMGTYESGEIRRQPGIDDEGGANFLYPVSPPLPEEPPSNNSRASALMITTGMEIQGTLREATLQDGDVVSSFICGRRVQGDVWYKYVPDNGGMLEVSMCGSGVICAAEVFESGPGDTLTRVDCASGGCKSIGTIQVPRFSVPVESQKTYLLRIGSDTNNLGPFLVSLELTTSGDNVAQYLAGHHDDDTGLDRNSDELIDAGDVVAEESGG